MSSDPLTHVPPGPPCPSCGSCLSIQALTKVRDELYRKKLARGHAVQGKRTLQAGGSSHSHGGLHSHGSGLHSHPNPARISAGGGSGGGPGGPTGTIGGGGGGGGAGGGAVVVSVAGNLHMAPGSRISAGSKIPPIQAGGGLKVSGSSGGSGAPLATNVIGGLAHVASKAYVDNALTDHSGADSVQIDGLICARCGTFFKPDAGDEGTSLEQEIRGLRLELDSAVDLLGRIGADKGGDRGGPGPAQHR